MPHEPITLPTEVGARALLRQRDFIVFLGTRVAAVLGTVAQSVTIGWQVYDLARAERGVAESALYVGLVGLATFLPLVVLALPAGVVADRYPRKAILMGCFAGQSLLAGTLAWTAATGMLSVRALIGFAFIFGITRAFFAPANAALAPMLVPPPLLPRAIAWNSLAFQIGTISGPALAGLLVGHWSSAHSYAVSLTLYLLAAAGLTTLRRSTRPTTQPGSRIEQVREGLHYIRDNKLVLGAISLDMVAVLLGGATALLPVFARDILLVGPQGFGLMRSAPAVGAATVALVLASRPIQRRAGLSLFTGVAIFGVATVVFGLSRSLWLSLVALAVLGGADMVSVYVRQTLARLIHHEASRDIVRA